MRRLILLLLFFSTMVFATDNATETFEQKTSDFTMEIGNSWQILSVLALLVSIALVAIAYMFGTGLEMPELQAWAKTEFSQVFANAIIILALFGTITLIDLLVIGIITDTGDVASGGIPLAGCNLNMGGTSRGSVQCLQDVTEYYLSDQMYENIKTEAKNVLDDNAAKAGWAGRRFGINCLSIYCAQLGLNMGFFGFYALYVDMNNIIFEHYTTLLSFIGAQKFFVTEICFNMGPVILAIGIVARSFFLTRKVGGLLIAISIGCMFFFPGMYIFDWFTLQMAINGDGVMDSEDSLCPSECGSSAPIAYVSKDGEITKFYNTASVVSLFESSSTAEILLDGTIAALVATNDSSPYEGGMVYSCYFGVMQGCPTACRELPYPAVSQCIEQTHNSTDDINVPLACAQVPDECKVVRLVEEVDVEENASCPQSCKVIPPLASDCRNDTSVSDITDDDHDDDTCLTSSYDCRLAKRDDLDWRPTKENADEDAQERCEQAADCRADEDAYNNCVYIVPPTGTCEEACGGCEAQCRIQQFTEIDENSDWDGDGSSSGDWTDVPDECKDGSQMKEDCNSCPEGCKVNYEQLVELKEAAESTDENYCSNCDAYKLLLSTSPQLPVDYTSGDTCGLNICPAEYRLSIPINICEMCIYTQEEYMYDPPINNNCQDLCGPSDERPEQDLSSLTKIGETGLVGRPIIQDLAKYMVPVYILPLFNVVATLIFIKSLSHVLGGDIEIPGISKVF